MKKVVMMGNQFSRMITVLRGFVNKSSAPIKDENTRMFYLEFARNEKTRSLTASGYATDGYRAVKVDADLWTLEGEFSGYMKNPAILPKNMDFVEITLEKGVLFVEYKQFGIIFRTPQPKKSEMDKTIKTYLEEAQARTQNAEFTVNPAFMKEAMAVIDKASSGIKSNHKVKVSVGKPVDPILMEGSGVYAIVCPMRPNDD